MSELNPENLCADLLENNVYKKDALNYMMKMQYDLQKFVADKRGNIAPDSKVSLFDFAKETIYYWGCVTAEYAELQERDWCDALEEKEATGLVNEDLLETQFEYIDMYHFLMNFFIFSKITEFDLTLEDLFDRTPSFDNVDPKLIELQWSYVSILAGEFIDILPYKHWKTYDNDMQLDQDALMQKAIHMLYAFILMGKSLGIDKERFYDLYISKNKENYNRQNNNY
tara:strand:- start:3041 stop:3718 length:678 start_codon:yes stop_codon:yes gene_type:complete